MIYGLIFDKELVNKKILCHPNVVTKTMTLDYKDLIKIIENEKHQYIVY